MTLAASVLLLGLVACTSNSTEEDTTPVEASQDDDVTAQTTEVAQPDEAEVEEPTVEQGENEAEEPNVDDSSSTFDIFGGASEDDVQVTGSGLQYVILKKGDGDRPQAGQVVSVHYIGWLEDGTMFDSSVDRGTPFQFPLGQRQVIAGWDEGIALLNEGDKARLIIPSDLGYGESGSPGTIPPNATLVFEVELLGIQPGSPESPAEVSDEDYLVSESGLRYFDLETGEGLTPEEGQLVLIHFTAWLEDGTKLGSSIDSGQPLQYLLGSEELFPGFEEGLETMQVGGVRQLVIPPELAYGEAGAGGGQIPPDATLIFELELLEIP